MSRFKRRRDTAADDGNVLFEGDFDADEFADGGSAGDEEAVDHGPARRRLELRSEERWLRQQLSDWDDLEEAADDP